MIHLVHTAHSQQMRLTCAVMRAKRDAGTGHGRLRTACDATAELEGASTLVSCSVLLLQGKASARCRQWPRCSGAHTQHIYW